MEFTSNTKAIAQQFIDLWTDATETKPERKDLPEYLKNQFLIDTIAQQSNTVIQVFDMNNFKTICTSPNCLEITGFTNNELNNFGVLYWLSTIPLKQSLFYIKSAQFVNQKIKKLAKNELLYYNQCINLAYKNKNGERKSMVSTNICIEWKNNKQSYQLILWQDMTHKFKSKEFLVRYQIGSEIYNYQSEIGKFKVGDILSLKEHKIIQFCKENITSKDIAEQLQISPHTVDNHKKNILNKLQTTTMNYVIEILNFIGLK